MLFGQKDCGYREVVVGNDRKLIARVDAVARKDCEAVFQVELVFLAVPIAQASPIAMRIPNKKLGWSWPTFSRAAGAAGIVTICPKGKRGCFAVCFMGRNSSRKGLRFLA